MHPANLAIIIYFVLEFWAILLFLRQPGLQLHDPKPPREAVLICHSYAGTLLSLNAVCFMYLFFHGVGEFDGMGTPLSWSLSIYHFFPIHRAWDRIKRREEKGSGYKSEYDVGGGPKGNLKGLLFILATLVSAGTYGLVTV